MAEDCARIFPSPRSRAGTWPRPAPLAHLRERLARDPNVLQGHPCNRGAQADRLGLPGDVEIDELHGVGRSARGRLGVYHSSRPPTQTPRFRSNRIAPARVFTVARRARRLVALSRVRDACVRRPRPRLSHRSSAARRARFSVLSNVDHDGTPTTPPDFPSGARGGPRVVDARRRRFHGGVRLLRALKTAVDNCLDATPDGTGASCCSSAGADCGVAGSVDMPDWNVTGVTNFSELFLHRVAFDQNISAWDVSAVTDMRATFRNASSFDADISAWNVSSVTDMRATFRDAAAFSADVRAWPTVSVLDRRDMFLGADTWLALHDHPPSFVSHLGVAYPHVPASLVRETRATLQFRVDADAVAYFLAVPVGFAALNRTVPTSAEVREGTNGPVGTFGRDGLVSGSIDVAAGETASANVTNLTEASSSDVWVTAATRNGTLQSHVSLVDVRTRDMTRPFPSRGREARPRRDCSWVRDRWTSRRD